jgi:hypothetical protein
LGISLSEEFRRVIGYFRLKNIASPASSRVPEATAITNREQRAKKMQEGQTD